MGWTKKLVNFGEEAFANFGIVGTEAPEDVEEFATERGEDGLPLKVDLRKHCTEVEDQKQSNSCCANAVAGAYEYLAKKTAEESGDEVGDISRLFIYFVGRKADLASRGNPNLKVKDEGMSIGGAIRALQSKGACLAESWPFDLDAVNAQPAGEAFDQAVNYKISKGINVPVDVTAMKQCLADGHPIVFGLKLTKRFFSPGSQGIIHTPDPEDPQSASHGLHAMLAVGYSEPDQVFIVRNSWGSGWGHEGYCYIPFDYMGSSEFNFCGQYAIKGLSDYDLTPEDDGDDTPLLDPENDDGQDEPEVEEVEEEVDEDDAESENDYGDMFDKDAEAMRVFNKFDKDGSGAVSKKELRKALRAMGVFVPKFMIKEIMEKYNDDGEKGLDIDEFKNVLTDLGFL